MKAGLPVLRAKGVTAGLTKHCVSHCEVDERYAVIADMPNLDTDLKTLGDRGEGGFLVAGLARR